MPNVKRIQILIDHLKTLPKGSYFQRAYYGCVEGKCAIGHSFDIKAFNKLGYKATPVNWWQTVSYKGETDEEKCFAKLMGITLDEASWISIHNYTDKQANTPTEAIKRLTALAEGRVVKDEFGNFKIKAKKKVLENA